MPRSMVEVHALGHHAKYPHARCPDCTTPHGGRIEVRGVLAGAYASGGKSRCPPESQTMLTHAVVVSVDGLDVKTLCNKVKLDSLCDVVVGGEPTCPTCARRYIHKVA